MSRKYIEARKSFSGLTSEQLSSEDEIEMNDDRITLTLKLPVGEQSQIAASSMGKPYLSLCLANHETGDDTTPDQRRSDLAYERPGYVSEAVARREVTVPPSGRQIQVSPFAYEALDTPVRQDQGGLVVSERDLVENCGVAKETPITGSLLGPEKDKTRQRVESHFVAIKSPPRDGIQDVKGQAQHAQVLATDARAGSVTEYCFMDVRSVAATDDPCPMLFGQKLSRRPAAESSSERQEPKTRPAEDNSPKQLPANIEVTKESFRRSQELPPPKTALVASPEKSAPEEVKEDLPAKEPLALEKAEAVSINQDQPDSEVPKRVGRIIKLPASVVGSGPLEFDDRSGSPWNSKKRWRTGYDKESLEKDHPKMKPSRERVCGSDGEEERTGKKKHWREDDISRRGRRVTTARDFSPRTVREGNDMYNLKISTSGPHRNVFNRIAGPHHKETVFNRLNYGEYDDTVIMDKDYRQRRDNRYREDDHGIGRFHRSSMRSAYIGSSSRDHEKYKPRVKGGAYYRRSLERDISRSPEKVNIVYTRAISETLTPTEDIETNATLRSSKVSGWDKAEGSKEPERLSSYVPFPDRMDGRSCSPDGYVSERSRKMRFDSPSHQPRARHPREHAGSVYDERADQRASSHQSSGKQPESWESLHGYSTFESKQRQQRPVRTYSEEESSAAEMRTSGVLKHDAFEPKALQDFLGSARSYPSTSNPSDMEQTAALGLMEHMDRNETNGTQKLVDYLGEFDCERRPGKPSIQARDKERISTVSQNGYLAGSDGVRSPEDVEPRQVYAYDLNFGVNQSETVSAPRNKNVPGRRDQHLPWEERASRQVSAGTRDISSTDVWPEERLELSINRYREKVCY